MAYEQILRVLYAKYGSRGLQMFIILYGAQLNGDAIEAAQATWNVITKESK